MGCLKMELYDGTLENLKGKFKNKAQEVVKQLFKAAKDLHNNPSNPNTRFLHRDLKPANILCSEKGGTWKCVLADFGLSERLRPGKDIYGKGGSLGWIAPEAVSNIPEDHYRELGRINYAEKLINPEKYD